MYSDGPSKLLAKLRGFVNAHKLESVDTGALAHATALLHEVAVFAA